MGSGASSEGARGDREAELYTPGAALPLVDGAAFLLGGVAIAASGAGRYAALEGTFYPAILLVGLGIVLYFVIGLWLVPAAVALAGVIFYLAHDLLFYHLGTPEPSGVAYLAIGAALLLAGARRAWPRERPDPPAP